MTWDPHRWENRVEVEDESDTVDYGYGAVSKGTKSPYLPFGAGRHRCIGEKFAYLNLDVIVATLVREFRFYNPEDREGVPETDYSVRCACDDCFTWLWDLLTDFGYSPCSRGQCSLRLCGGSVVECNLGRYSGSCLVCLIYNLCLLLSSWNESSASNSYVSSERILRSLIEKSSARWGYSSKFRR